MTRGSRRFAARLAAVLLAAPLMAGLTASPVLTSPARAEEVVNLYSWADYFPEDVIKAFEKETGIKVKYDTFDSNEVLESKLSAGQSGYDVVIPNASPNLARQIPAHFYQPLDRAKLKNYGNLDPDLMQVLARADPGNKYAVPWMWGTTGIGYNRAAVLKRIPDAKFDSLAILLDPANAKRLADCGIGLIDSPNELIPAALAYMGKEPYSMADGDIQAGAARIAQIRPYVKSFNTGGQSNSLADGDMCIVFGYSGDAYIAESRAKEAGNGITIEYSMPREMMMAWIDTMAIPADAPHAGNAYKFIDFMLRPENAAAATKAYGFANGNKPGTALLSPAVRDNPSIYPPVEQVAKLQLEPLQTAKYQRDLRRAWTKAVTGQ